MPRFPLVPTLLSAATALLIAGSLFLRVEADGTTSLPKAARPVDTLRDASTHVFEVTNQKRREQNLNPLAPDETLRRIACHHSRDMLARNFFQHETPEGEGPSDRVAQMHRQLIGEAGENLWGQTGTRTDPADALATRIVEQWMNSPPHRENILRPPFTHMAVCIIKQGTTWRGTQMFAHVRAYLAAPLPRTAPAGSRIEALIERTVLAGTSIEKYDFWNPNENEKIAGPAPFADTLHLPQTTGPVRPRFYVPKSDRYSIHTGPEIEVTPPN